MFQKYKEKKEALIANPMEQAGFQETQNIGMGNSGKGNRKRGRRPMSEKIQVVGETLVNSGRAIPLSKVYQQHSKSSK